MDHLLPVCLSNVRQMTIVMINTGHYEEDLVADQSAGTSTTFTLEEELLFAQRLEEGYDLVDPKYTEWLKYNVPPQFPGCYNTH